MTTAFEAMIFAREVHKDQRRKYTCNPYTDHLAEVAGIAMTACPEQLRYDVMAQVCWLHDCMEDQCVTLDTLEAKFGSVVAGNRAERKAASRERLSKAWAWVQTIKVADLISNTASIVQHDPKFAAVYLEEKRLLLDVLTRADPRLVAIARAQIA
jgi:GTP diphosphokinase / guanosine-3',5'-bis(diphosphate) 3'-diphosphatase